MKKITFLVGLLATCQLALAQQPSMQSMYETMWKQQEMEAKTYYAGADTAAYGIRYVWSYQFNKEKHMTFHEDRVVWVSPRVTVDMSYQSLGEKRWLTGPVPDRWSRRDPQLSYHLTPSFYFYFPQEKRLDRTYRVITEEFLLSQQPCNHSWQVQAETKQVGGYRCQKAVCEQGGRQWTAWFTQELPYVAAPRTLQGLPGVVLEAYDATGEIRWAFKEKIESRAPEYFFIKYPEKFSTIAKEHFPVLVKMYATSNFGFIQKSGVMNKVNKALPEKLYPSTGLDACVITNPIER